MGWTVGIDLGGTKIDIGLVDGEGTVHGRELIPTRVKEGPEAVVDDIAAVVRRLINLQPGLKVSGIGIGMAGQIDKVTGTVFFAPNLGWNHFPLQEKVSQATGLPVRVINDVRAATWGEWLHGAGKGERDLLCIFVGTGIGGGVVSGGKMLIGDTNAAGEVGHMTIDMHGPVCACGNRGCFEALAGGRAVSKHIKEHLAAEPTIGRLILELAGGKLEDVTTKHLFEAYHQGDSFSIQVVEALKKALIAGVSGLVNAFNPRKVILGGGVLLKNPELLQAIREGVPSRALKMATKQLEIVEVELKGNAGVIGAAAFMNSVI